MSLENVLIVALVICVVLLIAIAIWALMRRPSVIAALVARERYEMHVDAELAKHNEMVQRINVRRQHDTPSIESN